MQPTHDWQTTHDMNRLESLVHKLTCLRVSQSAILASTMLHNNENLRAPQPKFNNPPGKKKMLELRELQSFCLPGWRSTPLQLPLCILKPWQTYMSAMQGWILRQKAGTDTLMLCVFCKKRYRERVHNWARNTQAGLIGIIIPTEILLNQGYVTIFCDFPCPENCW